jgi:hypothetical protein
MKLQLKISSMQPTDTVMNLRPARRLAYWDISTNDWHVERDRIEIRVGASSTDIRLKQTIAIE